MLFEKWLKERWKPRQRRSWTPHGNGPASSLSVGESAAETSERGPLASSAGAISSTLGSRLAWWKVAGLGRVDDVRTEVEGAVVAGWGRGAEERVSF